MRASARHLYTATVGRPSSCAVASTRQAISPRLATRSLPKVPASSAPAQRSSCLRQWPSLLLCRTQALTPRSARERRLRVLRLSSKALEVMVTCIVGAEQPFAAVKCCALESAETGTDCLAAVAHCSSTHSVICFRFHSVANARKGRTLACFIVCAFHHAPLLFSSAHVSVSVNSAPKKC